MSLLIGTPHRQVCSDCNWQSPHIVKSDVMMGLYKKCPECGGTLNLKPLNMLEQLFNQLTS